MSWVDDMAEVIASLENSRIVCTEDGVTNYCAHGEHEACCSYCLCPCHEGAK